MDALQKTDLAQRLRAARDTGVPIAPIRELVGVADVDAAYAIQDINTRDAIASGRRLTGRKIGLTSLAVQKQLGVSQPDFGMLFADMQVGEGEPIAMQRLQQPKIEAEIALILGHDLAGDELTTADVLRATAYVLPALEIVGSRIENWNIGIVDTVADNASAGAYVLGTTPRKLADFDLRLAGMAMLRRGEPVSTGAGAACLGHPLNAVVWLARTMARLGAPLRAGDLVLSGALGPMVAVTPGDIFETHINGLGSVRAAFAAAPGGDKA